MTRTDWICTYIQVTHIHIGSQAVRLYKRSVIQADAAAAAARKIQDD